MASIQSMIVLRNLKKLSGNTENVITYLGNTTCFCLYSDYKFEKTYDYQKYSHEIHALIDSLEKQGYIKFENGSEDYFKITEKAFHPFQEPLYTFLGFLVKSIFIPIFVSLITTLVTIHFFG